MSKLITVWFGLFGLGILMFIISKWVYGVWIGDKVNISYSMSALVFTWVILNTWNGIFSHFLNGVGKVKLQMIFGITGAIINVPLAIFLGQLIGVEGVLIANLIVILPSFFLYPVQYHKIINNNAKGLFNK